MRQPSYSLIQVFLLITLSFVISISGCQKSTKPETESLVGTVILLNDSGDPLFDLENFSGVSLRLYELAQLDTSIVNCFTRHPSIGFQISQVTEFDHFTAQPLYSTLTNSDGHFQLVGIPHGIYNVVAAKEGWGFSYMLECDVSDNTGKNALSITLYPETIMASVIMDDFDFQADHIYIDSMLTV